jgi:hypothetical protein
MNFLKITPRTLFIASTKFFLGLYFAADILEQRF